MQSKSKQRGKEYIGFSSSHCNTAESETFTVPVTFLLSALEKRITSGYPWLRPFQVGISSKAIIARKLLVEAMYPAAPEEKVLIYVLKLWK